jgi:hypothetical protein
MNLRWLPQIFVVTAFVPTSVCISAQTSPPIPPTIHIKKAVVFLQTDCLHDFGPDISEVTKTLANIPQPPQLIMMKTNLKNALMRLQKLKESIAKLTREETAMLEPKVLSTLDPLQIGNLVAKMANLNDEDLKKLTPKEIATLPTDPTLGTGFVVFIPVNPLIPVPPEEKGKDFGFGYLVTNRHVVQPGIEEGKPCHVVNYSVLLNRRVDSTQNEAHAELVSLLGVTWHFSTDESVDLAVIPFSASPGIYDYERIPVGEFVTQEMVEKKTVVEGDPVLFSGLFVQSFQEMHSLEPIVRSGSLAMIPNGVMETTLHKPGRVYLAEAHSFGGNSGSPVFVDTSKFVNPFGYSYKLLGVISGEVLEGSDLVLHVTTSYNAKIAANSDVSVVVPADEIKKIIDDPALKAMRDAYK